MSSVICRKINHCLYKFKRSNKGFCNLRKNLWEVNKTLSHCGKKKSKKN